MIEYISQFFEQYKDILIWLTIASLVMFVASIFLIPKFLKNMPIDYFINPKYHQVEVKGFKQIMIFIIKNIIGLFFIIIGVIMIFTPGQGVISIIIGLFLMQFKGKFYLEKKLIQNNITFNTLNWIRKKINKPNFERINERIKNNRD